MELLGVFTGYGRHFFGNGSGALYRVLHRVLVSLLIHKVALCEKSISLTFFFHVFFLLSHFFSINSFFLLVFLLLSCFPPHGA